MSNLLLRAIATLYFARQALNNLLSRLMQPREYRIGRLNLNELVYEEGGRKVEVLVEARIHNPFFDFTLYCSPKQHWMEPHENELVGHEKQQQIVERVKTYISNNPQRVEVIDDWY